ncbi:MAG: hypothetical protein H6968_04680 [Chromatiaceae bacterium]|nr:hypothetical protein [Chromatiaceae bacterium]
MSKWFPWSLFGTAFLAAVYIFVLLLDAGASLSNARSETERIRDRSDLVLSILRRDWLGKKAASVTELSEALHQKGVITGNENGLLEIGDLIFETKDGFVTDIRYID